MKITRLLYLISFFAPVAFLCGYILGAPRYQSPSLDFNRIDARAMPVSAIDFYNNEATIAVGESDWLKPNTHPGLHVKQ